MCLPIFGTACLVKNVFRLWSIGFYKHFIKNIFPKMPNRAVIRDIVFSEAPVCSTSVWIIAYLSRFILWDAM